MTKQEQAQASPYPIFGSFTDRDWEAAYRLFHCGPFYVWDEELACAVDINAPSTEQAPSQ